MYLCHLQLIVLLLTQTNLVAMVSNQYPLVFLSFLVLSTSSMAFNITKILDQYQEFSTFNTLLTQTKVADDINSRSTLTVLALDNAAAGAIAGEPADVLKREVSVHVVLDYFDVDKLAKLAKKASTLTTLFQTSGAAAGQEGFLNVTVLKYSGGIAVGSAAPGSILGSKIVKLVASQPYNISVLQISSAIVPAGIQNVNASSATPPPPATRPAFAPKSRAPPAPVPAAPAANAPTTVVATPTPAADAVPVPAGNVAPAPSGGDGKEKANGPSKAPSTSSPRDVVADHKSSGSRTVSGVAAVVGMVLCLAAVL